MDRDDVTVCQARKEPGIDESWWRLCLQPVFLLGVWRVKVFHRFSQKEPVFIRKKNVSVQFRINVGFNSTYLVSVAITHTPVNFASMPPSTMWRMAHRRKKCAYIVSSLTGRCSEGLGAFWFLFKQDEPSAIIYSTGNILCCINIKNLRY